MNLDPQSAFRPVESRYAATMKAHRPFGDGEAQTNSAGLPAAIIVQPVKWLEKFFQRVRRNARSTVGDAHHRFRAVGGFGSLQMNFDGRTLARIPDGVAHDVLDCAV